MLQQGLRNWRADDLPARAYARRDTQRQTAVFRPRRPPDNRKDGTKPGAGNANICICPGVVAKLDSTSPAASINAPAMMALRSPNRSANAPKIG